MIKHTNLITPPLWVQPGVIPPYYCYNVQHKSAMYILIKKQDIHCVCCFFFLSALILGHINLEFNIFYHKLLTCLPVNFILYNTAQIEANFLLNSLYKSSQLNKKQKITWETLFFPFKIERHQRAEDRKSAILWRVKRSSRHTHISWRLAEKGKPIIETWYHIWQRH